MGVVAERAERGGLPRPLEERGRVLAVGRRPQEGGDREAARPLRDQRPVAAPDLIVERSFDVARDDRVAFGAGHVPDSANGEGVSRT